MTTKTYPLTFDSTSKSYLPLTIRLRAKLWDKVSVDLKNQIDISDAEGYSFINQGKLRVIDSSKKLIESRRAAEFTVEVGPNLTLDDLINGQGKTKLKCTLYPDKQLPVPGAPIPVDAPPISSVCEIEIGLPVFLETETDALSAIAEGRNGIYISARVAFHLPIASPDLEPKFRDCISFVQRSGQIVIDSNPILDGQWKRVFVSPLPGCEHLTSEQVNTVEITAKVLHCDLLTRVTFNFDTQGIELHLLPSSKLRLNGRDKVKLLVILSRARSSPLPQSDLTALFASLQLTLEGLVSNHVIPGSKQQFSNEVVWELCGNPAVSSKPPSTLQLRVKGNLRGLEISASTILTLEEDNSQMDAFFNPSPPLELGVGEGIWVYAKVQSNAGTTKAEATQATRNISFVATGPNANLLSFADIQDSNDYHCARIIGCLPPSGTLASGVPTVEISTSVRSSNITTSLSLPLMLGLGFSTRLLPGVSSIAKYSPTEKKWLIPKIIAWFFRPGDENTPVANAGDLAVPAIHVNDQVVICKTPKKSPSGAWEILLEVNTAKIGNFDQIVERDGFIKVEIIGISKDNRKPFKSEITLHFELEYELIVEHVNERGAPFSSVPYVDPAGQKTSSEIEQNDIVCDARNSMCLKVNPVRLDRKYQLNQKSISKDISPPTFEIIGPDIDCFRIEREEAKDKQDQGTFFFRVTSTKPLLASDDRTTKALAIRFQLTTTKANSKQTTTAIYKANMRLIFLKLWAYPGMIRGQTVISAFAALMPNRACPIGGLDLELRINCRTWVPPRLTVQGSAISKTSITGLSHWNAAYSDLQWDNIKDAAFHLQCRVSGGSECIICDIDVAENGKRFLSELNRRASILDSTHPESLNLNNPEFVRDDTWLSKLDYAIPDDARGAYYDVRANFYSPGPSIPTWVHCYTCGEMRKRITDFAISYRYDKATGLAMNGIEFGNYALGDVHDFFGIHLSGQTPKGDPWFLDPWWRQQWKEDEIAHSWKTEYWKASWVVVTLLCHISLLCIFIYASGRFIYQGVKHLLPDFSKWEWVQRLRTAIEKWLTGKASDPNSTWIKVRDWSWFAFKIALLGPGLPYLLRPRVIAHGNYFEDNLDYKPTTLMKELERMEFTKNRANEYVADLPATLKPIYPVEVWR